jgi:hypothetical protein
MSALTLFYMHTPHTVVLLLNSSALHRYNYETPKQAFSYQTFILKSRGSIHSRRSTVSKLPIFFSFFLINRSSQTWVQEHQLCPI